MAERLHERAAMRTKLSLSYIVVAIAALAGCRTLEGASQSMTNGFRDTQQDLQHGIRGEPEPSDPAVASAAPPARPAPPPQQPQQQPQQQPPPAPAPAPQPANGVGL
jgi:hypothetical protein